MKFSPSGNEAHVFLKLFIIFNVRHWDKVKHEAVASQWYASIIVLGGLISRIQGLLLCLPLLACFAVGLCSLLDLPPPPPGPSLSVGKNGDGKYEGFPLCFLVWQVPGWWAVSGLPWLPLGHCLLAPPTMRHLIPNLVLLSYSHLSTEQVRQTVNFSLDTWSSEAFCVCSTIMGGPAEHNQKSSMCVYQHWQKKTGNK